jgi:predicted outer membrane protein
MKIKQLSLATFAVLLLGSSLVAQPPEARQPEIGANLQQQIEGALTKDQTFARCLAIANQEQVTLSGFAKEKATDKEVKQFAATLEKAHQSCLEQLNGISPPSESKANVVETTAAIASNHAASVDFLQLHQEISTQCLKDSQDYLSKKKGAEFDKCFVGMQVAKHAGMQSTLTVLQRHASGKLQGLIKDGLEKNAKHMEAAVNLMDRLTASDSSKLSKVNE